MDGVSDMERSIDTADEPLGSLRRREFLTKAAAAGVVVWSAPVILSRPAHAVDGGGGTPKCRPTFTLSCVMHNCQQGQKAFPGFTVSGATCPCADPPQRPITCIRITPLPGNPGFTCGGDPVVAYGAGTICGPLQDHPNEPDVLLNTGNWECFDASGPIFFGRDRAGGGAIPNLPSCTLEFRVAIWAGSCPDGDSDDDAFTCQTFIVRIDYNSSNDTVNCAAPFGFTPAPADQSLCTETPEDLPPCCPPVRPGPAGSCC
jgi:hypothetical protein